MYSNYMYMYSQCINLLNYKSSQCATNWPYYLLFNMKSNFENLLHIHIPTNAHTFTCKHTFSWKRLGVFQQSNQWNMNSSNDQKGVHKFFTPPAWQYHKWPLVSSSDQKGLHKFFTPPAWQYHRWTLVSKRSPIHVTDQRMCQILKGKSVNQ